MTPRVIHLPKGAAPAIHGADEYAEPTTLGKRLHPDVGTRIADLVPELGWARLTAEDQPSLSVLSELGAGVPRVTQGYADWEQTDRPNNISLTDWRGYKPLAIELPLYFDNLVEDRSVEGAVDILEALAGRGRLRPGRATGDYVEPPKVIVHTHGVMPYDAQSFPDMRWVITDLDWDDEAAIVNDSGNRVRAPVTVSLLQFVDQARLHDRAFAVRKRLQAKRPAARRPYTVKTGDTAITIARRQLGDPGRYQEILRLNGLRDPRGLRAGAVLRLPG